MREILFRGRRIDNGEWITGYYAGGNDFINDHTIYGSNDMIGWDVDPTTVGQYTGLKDRNGMRIFEGDIFPHPLDNKHKYVVGWDDETAGFGWFNGDGCGFDPKRIEIIGNIHDNPELMGGGSE